MITAEQLARFKEKYKAAVEAARDDDHAFSQLVLDDWVYVAADCGISHTPGDEVPEVLEQIMWDIENDVSPT
jgi:hypothetical protein